VSVSVSLWDFVSHRGRDEVREWARSIRMPIHVRAVLDQKLDVLRQQPLDLVLHTHLLAGPIGKHIYKLRVNGTVAVRLMLCQGPMPGEAGYTLLCGATERDRHLIPRDAAEQARRNRGLILADPQHRRRPHEPFGESS
jgi:hypothetical protein